jgi:WD40 repeat protein
VHNVAVGIRGHAVIAHLFALAGKRAMRLLPAIAMALVLARPAVPVFCETQPSPPSPTYVVHIPSLRVAEMSPDEKYLAALVVHWPKGVPPTAELQVWDFRRGTLLQSHSLPDPEARPGYPHGTTYLRYTSDGELLAVYTGGDLLHVLRATDLEGVRTVQIQSHAKINAFEVSPTGHRVAVCMSGDIRVYDLDSGEELRSWRINPDSEFRMSELLQVHSQLDGAGLAWRGDGGVLAVSVADNPRCLRGGGTIYIFDPTSNQGSKTFRVPLLPASIAFGTGNNLYVASNTCGGYFTHWTLDLPIFDSASGRETGKIPAGSVGFRGYMAISANKQILLAHADREKTTFAGFEDSLSITDEQWQVWDLSAGKLMMTFPATGRVSVGNYPSLSNSGHFVCANRAQDLEIFSVPVAEK